MACSLGPAIKKNADQFLLPLVRRPEFGSRPNLSISAGMIASVVAGARSGDATSRRPHVERPACHIGDERFRAGRGVTASATR